MRRFGAYYRFTPSCRPSSGRRPAPRTAGRRAGLALKRSDDELAFYDAFETNDSAVKVLGDLRKRYPELYVEKRAPTS
ncbi:MAG TPA: hypothetical protein VKE51_25275 [Vicinamibacterales bacterium]|nr:hypothetical protein [Vicinamibacterales bacterium]